jgi:hypothetical protein
MVNLDQAVTGAIHQYSGKTDTIPARLLMAEVKFEKTESRRR